jgi:hypothetical protein
VVLLLDNHKGIHEEIYQVFWEIEGFLLHLQNLTDDLFGFGCDELLGIG